MPYTIKAKHRVKRAPSFDELTWPLNQLMKKVTPLRSRGNRALKMTFEDQLNALIYFHLEEHCSGRHLLQSLKEDVFASEHIAPKEGIEKSSFFEAVDTSSVSSFAFLRVDHLPILAHPSEPPGQFLPARHQFQPVSDA